MHTVGDIELISLIFIYVQVDSATANTANEQIDPVLYIDSIIDAIYRSGESNSDAANSISDSIISRSIVDLDEISSSRADEDNGSVAPPVDQHSTALTIIFVNTARRAAELAEALKLRGIPCGQFHKLIKYSTRVEVLGKFKTGEVPVLVATDHASRSIYLKLLIFNRNN